MVIQTLQKQLEQKFNFMKNIIKLKSLSNIVDKYDTFIIDPNIDIITLLLRISIKYNLFLGFK